MNAENGNAAMDMPRQCAGEHDAQIAGSAGDACTGKPPTHVQTGPGGAFSRCIGDGNVARFSDRSAVLAESSIAVARETVAALSVWPANDIALSDCDAQASAEPISDPIALMMASGRRGLLDGLLPDWRSMQDIAVLGDPVADAARLPACLEQRRPDLLLLDRDLLLRLGPESLRITRAICPSVRVLLLGDAVYAGLVEEVLRHRLHGFLLTDSPPDVCMKAIRAVSRGELWLPRSLLAKAVSELLHEPGRGEAKAQPDLLGADGRDTLTHRERQMVDFLHRGFTNKQIARQLGIMEDTVKKHLQGVFGKLGVHRRALVVLHPVDGPSNLA